jgi:hypothetical protein
MAGASEPELLAAAGVSKAAAVAAVHGAGRLQGGGNERQNSDRNESEFDR